jgi:glycosyltransferase involved in cell wall biosynthesis
VGTDLALPFTVVVGYRNRDMERVERFLNSLRAQTHRGFVLIFVDFGSTTRYAQAAQHLVGQYDFARYVYTDTRGRPWSRSHALNIGVRLAETPYVITTDADMLYPADFLEEVAQHVHPDRVLYCATHFLPEGFDDWNHLERYLGQLQRGDDRQLGGFQCAPSDVMHRIRGFDEFYRYWGIEDTDLRYRFEALGLEIQWLNDHIHFFHQWHPSVNISHEGIVPDGTWMRMVLHNHSHRGIVERNHDDWGHCVTTDERSVYRFLDLDAGRLVHCSEMRVFDFPPFQNQSVAKVANQFLRLPSGHALVVNHAFFPAQLRWSTRIVRYGNRLLNGLYGGQTQISHRTNVLHNFLAEFVTCRDLVADYYLNFDALNGVSILVRA